MGIHPHIFSFIQQREQRQADVLNQSHFALKDDPLSSEQKLRIKSVFDYFLLDAEGFRKDVIRIYEAVQSGDDARLGPLDLQDKEEAQLFVSCVRNPASQASLLNIDPTNPRQLFAAKKFIKTLLKEPARLYSLSQIHAIYCENMASDHSEQYHPERSISRRNALLMANDPVFQGTPQSNVEWVLHRMYFEDPSVNMMGTTYGIPREQARALMRKFIDTLYQSPHLKPVFDALARLVQEKEIHFIIGKNLGMDDFFHRKQPRPPFSIANGFYNGKHTIYVSALIDPSDQEFAEKRTFICACLHMLFAHLVKNGCSPVKEGNEEELDQALAKDRLHRKKMDPRLLSEDEQPVWKEFVDLLENGHFQGSFDPSREDHLDQMRTVAIVQPLGLIAEGVSEKALETVCPNLWTFFKEHSLPLLLQYGKLQTLEGKRIAPIPPSKQADGTIAKMQRLAKWFFSPFVSLFSLFIQAIKNLRKW